MKNEREYMAGLGRGRTESVGSVDGKENRREPDTHDERHLGFDHMPEFDVVVEEHTERALDTKRVGGPDGGDDLFGKGAAVGLVGELLFAVFGEEKGEEAADDCDPGEDGRYGEGKLP
jgi:hypothetical protein